jgi:hypothetical protein
MIADISLLFLLKNRLSTLLIKEKACGERANQIRIDRETVFFLDYQILSNCQASDLSSHFLMPIGLDKLEGKSKGY